MADATDAFPLDSSESVDTDSDGIGNNADPDDDNDGVADATDAFPLNAAESVDTDGDGIGNNADTDDDNDGVADVNDAFPLNAAKSVDTDSDGIGNNADPDDDNDGVDDSSDAFPLNASKSVDTDGDGIGNHADTDDDGDAVPDVNDAFPLNAAESIDTDGDGTGNNADLDDDGDGVLDANDAFPLNSSESVDTDHDGIGNNADPDDDNDGITDATDAFPLDAGKVIHIAACTIYAVNDRGSNNSQFFTVNPATRQVAALGALRRDYDIEALAVDPASHILYGASGPQHRSGAQGRLFIVDGQDGSLTEVGRTGFPFIRGLAFHPISGALWGWTETGPVTINTATGMATQVRRIRGYTVDGLAWSNDGERLYLAEGNSLYTYDPDTQAIKRIDNFKRKIESLEMGPDGYLLMGQHGSKRVVIYDPLARRMVHGVDDDHHPSHYGSYRPSRIVGTINVSPYNDPEGIAWRVCIP